MYYENIFTKIIQKKINSEIIFENNHVLVINDISPKAKNHWLILPKNNYSDLKDFLNNASPFEQSAFFDCIKLFLNKVQFANVQFNVGEKAGQEILHLHAHVMSDSDLLS